MIVATQTSVKEFFLKYGVTIGWVAVLAIGALFLLPKALAAQGETLHTLAPGQQLVLQQNEPYSGPVPLYTWNGERVFAYPNMIKSSSVTVECKTPSTIQSQGRIGFRADGRLINDLFTP